MARQPYKEDQNIHSMTTRQLRQYISDKATEAQSRLDSADMDEASRAFKDAASAITNRAGTKVRRSTSYMTLEEMREYAYSLRQFNSLDTTSSFAKSIEWKENKQRYETFIKNQIQKADGEYWKKYITPKGNVSRKGYEDYKRYIAFIKSVKEVQDEYGYRTLKQYGVDSVKNKDPERAKIVSKLLNEVYTDSEGKGLTQAQLVDRFLIALQEYDSKEKAKAKIKKTASKVKVKTKKPKSKTNIKVKKTGKMRTDGTVRERLT